MAVRFLEKRFFCLIIVHRNKRQEQLRRTKQVCVPLSPLHPVCRWSVESLVALLSH